jgi:uncharacterized protein YutE (UPF0331/DUF86 family)
MTLRPEVVYERLRKLREVVANLETLRHLPCEELAASFRNYWLAERGLQLATEILFDIGNHILAGRFDWSPSTYEEIPQKLCERKVISEELRDRLRGLGGFRNILVHDYLDVDHDLLYGFLQEELGCFLGFADEVEDFLGS